MKKLIILSITILVVLFNFSCEQIGNKKLSNEDFVGTYKMIEVNHIDTSSFVAYWDSLCLNQTVQVTLNLNNSDHLDVLLSETCEPYFNSGWRGHVSNNILRASKNIRWTGWGSNITDCTIIYSLEGEWNEDQTTIDIIYSWTECTILGNEDPVIIRTEVWEPQ